MLSGNGEIEEDQAESLAIYGILFAIYGTMDLLVSVWSISRILSFLYKIHSKCLAIIKLC